MEIERKKSAKNVEPVMEKKDPPLPTPEFVKKNVLPKRTLPAPDIYELMLHAQNEVDSAIHELESYLQAVPSIAQMAIASSRSTYNLANDSLKTHIGEHKLRRLSLELVVENQSKGFLKGKDLKATIKIDTAVRDDPRFCDSHDISYVIPKEGELEDATMGRLVASLSKIVLAEGYDPVETAGFIHAIASMTGIPRLGTSYFVWRLQMLATDVNKHIQGYLKGGKTKLSSIGEKAKRTQRELEGLTREKAEYGYVEILRKAQLEMDAHIGQVKGDLLAYRESYIRNLEDFRRAEEVDYTFRKSELDAKQAAKEERYNKKIASLKQKEAALDERELKQVERLMRLERELQEKYAQKEELLDKKLAGHREKVDSESGKILQTLDILCVDVPGKDYGDKVDHDLRLFYAKLWHSEVRDCEHMSLGDSIFLVNELRNKCFPAKTRPRGRDVRWLYAGVRAVADYLSTHDVQMVQVLNNIGKMQFEKKPTVEECLEKALMYDFNMDKYLKGLHRNSDKSRADLGIQ